MKLNAYCLSLLSRLAERERWPLEEVEGDALHRLDELGLVDIWPSREGQTVGLSWRGIVKIRELRL